MNDREKSDTGIVAAKPTNKPGQPGGGIGGAKAGKRGKREPAKHAPDTGPGPRDAGAGGVWQAARQRKTERFTALLHHIDVDMLRAAFLALKRRTVCGASVRSWGLVEFGES